MQSLTIFALFLALSSAAQAKLDVHEWGTFTSLVGSNGETQNGMYHEDEPLPNFVHGFGETIFGDNESAPAASLPPGTTPPPPKPCRSKACLDPSFLENNIITQKMETPVIYFYSDSTYPTRVSVNVRFPDGVLTETFPGPTKTYPTKTDKAIVGNGNTTFTLDVLDKKTKGNFLPVNPGNIYGYARNVASNVVRYGSEQEQFIFYRGIGRFQPRLTIFSSHGNLNLQSSAADAPKAAFLVYVAPNGMGQMIEVKGIGGRGVGIKSALIDDLKDPNSRNPAILSGTAARIALESALKNSGLNPDEAKAMIDTWENGYLKVPGLRLLYTLPRAEIDQILPLTISPTPTSIQRAFVARIEILLDTDEISLMNRVIKEGASFPVESLGRFAEPMLRRVAVAYQEYSRQNELAIDKTVVANFQTLITKAAKGSGANTSTH